MIHTRTTTTTTTIMITTTTCEDLKNGKYNLNHIWDRVIFNTPGLKIGSSQNLVHTHNNGQTQTNPPNRHPQIIIGHSEHALNSEYVLRES